MRSLRLISLLTNGAMAKLTPASIPTALWFYGREQWILVRLKIIIQSSMFHPHQGSILLPHRQVVLRLR